MTGRLSAYLRRRVGLQILALLAVLTAMMQLLELLDVTTEILERGQGVGGLLYYALLRLPAELGLALPLAVLLGTMGVLNSMARTLEITAMRASGVSLMRMLGYLMLWPHARPFRLAKPQPMLRALADAAEAAAILAKAAAAITPVQQRSEAASAAPAPRPVLGAREAAA